MKLFYVSPSFFSFSWISSTMVSGGVSTLSHFDCMMGVPFSL